MLETIKNDFSTMQTGTFKEGLATLGANPANPMFRDQLTGLPNRAHFMLQLEEALWRLKNDPSYTFAVLHIDIRRFKAINTAFGYAGGDQLLRAIAERLEACMDINDTVARLGNDRFAILLDSVDFADDAELALKQITNVFKSPFNLYEHQIELRANIGVALASVRFTQADEMLASAEMATSLAKRDDKGLAIFGDDEYAGEIDRLHTESDLRRAVSNEELVIHYQPIVSPADGKITGVEALVRWYNPERGLVPPSEFIPLAEETGLVTLIDEYVLRTATNQLKEWHKAGHTDMHVAVNFSRRDFQDGVALRMVKDVLAESGIPAEKLDIEVTENMVMTEMSSSIDALREMMAAGIRVSMDDFGTGYSSLSCLASLPINTVKIDRSFVANVMNDKKAQCILKAVIDMSHILGFKVIAEGVETAEQAEFLAQQDCDEAQGFYYGRPVPAELISTLL